MSGCLAGACCLCRAVQNVGSLKGGSWGARALSSAGLQYITSTCVHFPKESYSTRFGHTSCRLSSLPGYACEGLARTPSLPPHRVVAAWLVVLWPALC